MAMNTTKKMRSKINKRPRVFHAITVRLGPLIKLNQVCESACVLFEWYAEKPIPYSSDPLPENRPRNDALSAAEGAQIKIDICIVSSVIHSDSTVELPRWINDDVYIEKLLCFCKKPVPSQFGSLIQVPAW